MLRTVWTNSPAPVSRITESATWPPTSQRPRRVPRAVTSVAVSLSAVVRSTPRRAPGRRECEQRRAHAREQSHESQCAQIGAKRELPGCGRLRQRRHQDVNAPLSHQPCRRAADDSEQDTLDEQLCDQPRTACAEGHPEGELARASLCCGRPEIPDVAYT